MSEDWADRTAGQLLDRGLLQKGVCLILGGIDTGKTTLTAAMAGRLAQSSRVGVIDADIGQSHIGPPATVGWAFVDKPQVSFSQLNPDGISFVGDVTPVGHLLQLTAAIAQCVRQASRSEAVPALRPTGIPSASSGQTLPVGRNEGKPVLSAVEGMPSSQGQGQDALATRIIIDTPGFIAGPAATALWWAVQRMVRPNLILAVQRENELNDVLRGMKNLGSQLELVQCPPWMPVKSPQARSSYRQDVFVKYFQDSCLYDIDLSAITIQTNQNPCRESLISRLVALRDKDGTDLAVGVVAELRNNGQIVTIRAPRLNISRVSCLVIGDVKINLTE